MPGLSKFFCDGSIPAPPFDLVMARACYFIDETIMIVISIHVSAVQFLPCCLLYPMSFSAETKQNFRIALKKKI